MVRLSQGVEGCNLIEVNKIACLITSELDGHDPLFVVFLTVRNVCS